MITGIWTSYHLHNNHAPNNRYRNEQSKNRFHCQPFRFPDSGPARTPPNPVQYGRHYHGCLNIQLQT